MSRSALKKALRKRNWRSNSRQLSLHVVSSFDTLGTHFFGRIHGNRVHAVADDGADTEHVPRGLHAEMASKIEKLRSPRAAWEFAKSRRLSSLNSSAIYLGRGVHRVMPGYSKVNACLRPPRRFVCRALQEAGRLSQTAGRGTPT